MKIKNELKKSLSCFLAAVLLLAAGPLASLSGVSNLISTTAKAATEDCLEYEISNGEATITGCDKSVTGDLLIPSTLGGCPVTQIKWNAFSGCTGLESVTIGNSVTDIGVYAFSGCTGLKNVTIGNGVKTIGDSAFAGCADLSSIVIPDGVTTIEDSAFKGTAYYNNSVNWENGVLYLGNHLIKAEASVSGAYEIKNGTKTLAERAFSDCTGLSSVTIPDSVKSIGNYAFEGCTGLTNATIGSGVAYIGSSAFENCHALESFAVPDSVTSIGTDAFYNTAYYQNKDNWENGVLYIGNHLIKADLSVSGAYEIKNKTKTIADYAFTGCTGLESVTIPAGVTTIGNYAFSVCTGLKSVTISEGVTTIGESAFFYCNDLKSVTVPKSVTEIGENAFGYYLNDSGTEFLKINGFTVYGYAGTAAEAYAAENEFSFVDLTHNHSYSETVTKPATCTEAGLKTFTCECGDTYTEVLPALGHVDENNDGKCDRCGESMKTTPEEPKDPSADCSCACHKKGIANFFFKIVLFFQKLFGLNKVCKCGALHY